MKGKIKFFERKKGFGFIKGEDGNDYFLIWNNIDKSIKKNPELKSRLRRNAKVLFDVGETMEKGPVAANVHFDEATE